MHMAHPIQCTGKNILRRKVITTAWGEMGEGAAFSGVLSCPSPQLQIPTSLKCPIVTVTGSSGAGPGLPVCQ